MISLLLVEYKKSEDGHCVDIDSKLVSSVKLTSDVLEMLDEYTIWANIYEDYDQKELYQQRAVSDLYIDIILEEVENQLKDDDYSEVEITMFKQIQSTLNQRKEDIKNNKNTLMIIG